VEIPVLDLSAARNTPVKVLPEWVTATVDVGCFRLADQGVPADVRQACLTAAKQFHEQSPEWKDHYAMSRLGGIKGYLPDDSTAKTDGSGRIARDYASLDLGPDPVTDRSAIESILLGPNPQPDIPGFQAAVDAYSAEIRRCAETVAEMLSRVCGLEPDHLARRSQGGCSLLRLLYYPEPARGAEEPPNGHTDYEWFTLIDQSAPGLEMLRPDGRRVVVPAVPGTLTVLIGDLLEVLSGGYLESTLHWVRSRQPDRYSLTYFYGPRFDDVVRPASPRLGKHADSYPHLHAGNHLTALRVRHLRHLRTAVRDGSLTLPFELPAVNPLKAAKERRLVPAAQGGQS
jgi:isopenicillin N synthase-like dioxygenase